MWVVVCVWVGGYVCGWLCVYAGVVVVFGCVNGVCMCVGVNDVCIYCMYAGVCVNGVCMYAGKVVVGGCVCMNGVCMYAGKVVVGGGGGGVVVRVCEWCVYACRVVYMCMQVWCVRGWVGV